MESGEKGVLFPCWLLRWGNECQRFLYWIGKAYIGEGNGNPLQYSCLENPMDGGAWWAAVHRVARSRTQLSNFTFTFHFHALEKEMATHSSVLVWKIQGTGEPSGLPSLGSHRVRHDWSDLAAAAARPTYKQERQMPYVKSKIGHKWTYLWNRLTDSEQACGYLAGGGWGKDGLGIWN